MPLDFELLNPSVKTFAELMKVKEVSDLPDLPRDSFCFQSTMAPFQPASAPGVFGGHVLAQSAYAASKTVPNEYVCHNTHGYFILPGKSHVPFVYVVTRIRDGRSYMTREVRVYQFEPEEQIALNHKRLCFVAICSFKLPEQSSLDFQKPLETEFAKTMAEIDHVPKAPDVDTPMWIKWAESIGAGPETHPVELRKLDTTKFNKERALTDRRIIHYFKSHDPLPENDVNLHIAALLYTSDRNSLFTILNIQDQDHWIRQIASIDHAFVCHDLNPRVDGDWLTMETLSDRAFDNRGLYTGRMYDSKGKLVCSFMQDGVVRLVPREDNGSKL